MHLHAADRFYYAITQYHIILYADYDETQLHISFDSKKMSASIYILKHVFSDLRAWMINNKL